MQKEETSDARKYLDDVFNRLFEEKDPKVIKSMGKIKHRIDKRDLRKESHKKKVLEDVYGIEKQENCGICGVLGGVAYDLEKMWQVDGGRGKERKKKDIEKEFKFSTGFGEGGIFGNKKPEGKKNAI